MPITKFSWPALKEHIRKFSWLYIVLIIISLFLSNLLWSMTRPRTPAEQQVLIYLASAISNPEMLDDMAQEMLTEGQAFDETLESVEFQSLMFANPETDYTSAMVLMARLSTGDADAFIATEDAMVTITSMDAALDLEEYMADGWLAESGLEGITVTIPNEETGESKTLIAALKLDSLDALKQRGAMENENAYLLIAPNSTNLETTMKTIEIMVEKLMEESSNVSAENSAPVA